MSKSIYGEALEIVADSLEEYDNSVIFKHTALNVIKKALEQAQKQEKLLKLYKEKDKYIKVFTPLPRVELDKYRNVVRQIKELEK